MQLDMTKGRPLPVILKFTIPLIIGNVFQQLYNMVDTIIVGRYVGADALAAVGSTGTIMFLLTGFSQGITAGFSILISQRYGAKDENGVKRAVANGIFLSIFFTLLLTFSCLFLMKLLLTVMNTPENIFDDAYSYIMIITAGIVANIFYNLLSAYLRAVGNSKVPLFFLVFSACLNVILDLFFIIRLHMGVSGAAWATNLAQAISAVLCAIYIWCKIPDLKPQRNQWKLSRIDTQKSAGSRHSDGITVCHHIFRNHDHAVCHQPVWFHSSCCFYRYRKTAKSADAGNDRHGTDHGDIQWSKLWLRRYQTNQSRCKNRTLDRADLCRCSRCTDVFPVKTIPASVFLR